MKLDREKMSILTSRGLTVYDWNDTQWLILKPNEVPGNFVEGYEQYIVSDETLKVTAVLNSPTSNILVHNESYYFRVMEHLDGLSPGDFANAFDSLDDCLQDAIDYYFGDPARMNEKKAVVERREEIRKRVEEFKQRATHNED